MILDEGDLMVPVGTVFQQLDIAVEWPGYLGENRTQLGVAGGLQYLLGKLKALGWQRPLAEVDGGGDYADVRFAAVKAFDKQFGIHVLAAELP